MKTRRAIVGHVPELDFVEMVVKRLSRGQISIAQPFLETVKEVMVEKKDFHSGIVDFHSGIVKECQETISILDKLVAAANEMVGHQEADQEPQEAVDQEPQQVDLSQVRCGDAVAADIEGCKKYRHALYPIAKCNNGILELKGATALIMAVMKPKASHNSMKASLGKFMTSSSDWERVSRGIYHLLPEGREAESVPEVVGKKLAEGELIRAAA